MICADGSDFTRMVAVVLCRMRAEGVLTPSKVLRQLEQERGSQQLAKYVKAVVDANAKKRPKKKTLPDASDEAEA